MTLPIIRILVIMAAIGAIVFGVYMLYVLRFTGKANTFLNPEKEPVKTGRQVSRGEVSSVCLKPLAPEEESKYAKDDKPPRSKPN